MPGQLIYVSRERHNSTIDKQKGKGKDIKKGGIVPPIRLQPPLHGRGHRHLLLAPPSPLGPPHRPAPPPSPPPRSPFESIRGTYYHPY